MTTHNLRVPAPSGCGSTLIWTSDAQAIEEVYSVPGPGLTFSCSIEYDDE